MKLYRIDFNDFGVVYVIAQDFDEALFKFKAAGYGGEDVEVKVITKLPETEPPLS